MASLVRRIIRKRIVKPISNFIKDSRAVGITLLVCTIVSLLLANSESSAAYTSFWLKIIPSPSFLHLPHHLEHWINDLLMAFFFFLVGMEIKKELLNGELSSIKKAVLPIAAAIGGMIFPAIIYILINKGSDYTNGWGIPMATDIAFSLGVASLLGSRVPMSLKIFLMALAIIDDLGAILVIALFYGEKINWIFMLSGALVCLVLALLSHFKKLNVFLICVLGLLLWYCIFNSGIHATIAGVLLAIFIPLNKLETYMHKLHKPVNFIILPLFALANTAIVIPGNFLANMTTTLSLGVMLGLIIGKPLGITTLSWLTVKLKWGEKPKNTSWVQMLGIGVLAGIGFTMSIFITMLAFDHHQFQDISKIAVLTGSVVAILAGAAILYFASRHKKQI